MIYYFKIYIISLVGFLAIDFVWLAFVARSFYRKHLGFLLSDQPNWWAAMAFYLLFVAGMLTFAVAPGLQAVSFRKALLNDKEKLTAILTYHVVPGYVTAADAMKLDRAKTLQGGELKIGADGGVHINDAKVIKTDILTANGVIHVIDSVLLPN